MLEGGGGEQSLVFKGIPVCCQLELYTPSRVADLSVTGSIPTPVLAAPEEYFSPMVLASSSPHALPLQPHMSQCSWCVEGNSWTTSMCMSAENGTVARVCGLHIGQRERGKLQTHQCAWHEGGNSQTTSASMKWRMDNSFMNIKGSWLCAASRPGQACWEQVTNQLPEHWERVADQSVTGWKWEQHQVDNPLLSCCYTIDNLSAESTILISVLKLKLYIWIPWL